MSHTFKESTSTSSPNVHVLILEVLSNVTVAHRGKDRVSVVIALLSLSRFQFENYTIIYWTRLSLTLIYTDTLYLTVVQFERKRPLLKNKYYKALCTVQLQFLVRSNRSSHATGMVFLSMRWMFFRIMKRCGTANGENNPQTLTQRSIRLQ